METTNLAKMETTFNSLFEATLLSLLFPTTFHLKKDKFNFEKKIFGKGQQNLV